MKNNTILFFVALIFIASQLCSCVTQSKDIDALYNHVSNLERARHQTDKNIRILEEKIAALEKGGNSNVNYASVIADIEALKEDVKLFNGRIEEANYLVEQKTKVLEITAKQNSNEIVRLDKANTLNSNRIIQVANYAGMEHNFAAMLPKENDKKDSESTSLEPKELYEIAKGLLEQGNPDNARIKFQEFLSLYPNDSLSDNCQFWLGEIFYRGGAYKKAILEFQKVIDNYHNGNKVPSALLRQAYAFEKLEEIDNAKLVLKNLIIKYPNSQEAKIGEKKLKIITTTETPQ